MARRYGRTAQKKVKRAICQPLDRGFGQEKSGAGNETRTRDPDLGKVVLYQLSYSRSERPAFYRSGRPPQKALVHFGATSRVWMSHCPFCFTSMSTLRPTAATRGGVADAPVPVPANMVDQ